MEMSNKEKLIKHIYSFFYTTGDVFTFYILSIGALALYSFYFDIKLLEVLNITLMYRFYLAIFCMYIILKGLKLLLFFQTTKIIELIVCSVISFTYLSFASSDLHMLIGGFIACPIMKISLAVYVKIEKYSTECIGVRSYTVDEAEIKIQKGDSNNVNNEK